MLDAILFLFLSHVLLEPSLCLNHAFLSPQNIYVDEFNDIILKHLPGEEHMYCSFRHTQIKPYFTSTDIYYSADMVKELDPNPFDPMHSPDFLTLLTHTGVPHELHLKEGAICTIMRNMSIDKGLIKNSQVVVHALHDHFVEVQPLNVNSQLSDNAYPLPRI